MKNPQLKRSVQTCTALSLLLLAGELAQASVGRSATPPASASPPTAFRTTVSVDALRIQNLQQYAGKTLHVFYVSGREAALGFSGQTLKIRAIKQLPTRFEIPASGEVLIPNTKVTNSGFQTFNYIVFAIAGRETQNLYLRNSDGTYPEDPRKPNYLTLRDVDFKTQKLGFISMIQLQDLRGSHLDGTRRTDSATATESPPIVLDGLRDF